MNYKSGIIARKIIELQHEDGTWGNEFHSLAMPNNHNPLTTEQALRRLKILGFSSEDACIRKTLNCMESCLRGERRIDDYWEKTIDWSLFTKLMLSAWIRMFEPENETALIFARQWANILEKAFEGQQYSQAVFQKVYMEEFYKSSKDSREIDFVNFYPINLLPGLLSQDTESCMLDYVIHHPNGIYYIYAKPICELPEVFESVDASRYLAAVEILCQYDSAKEKLGFVTQWLEQNRQKDGRWDMGPKVKDNVYFPLSDSWRSPESRKADCTFRINVLLEKLKG